MAVGMVSQDPNENIRQVEQPVGQQIEKPAVEQAPIQQVKQVPPKKRQVNMGGLPQWKTMLRDRRFKDVDSGKQNEYRENWLKTMISLNPTMNSEEQRYLRKQIYTINPDDYPLGSWNKTDVEAFGAKAIKRGLEPFGGVPPETKLPTGIEGGGKVIPKVIPSDRIGVTKFERALGRLASGALDRLKKASLPSGANPLLDAVRNIPNSKAIFTALDILSDGISRAAVGGGQSIKTTWDEAVALIDQSLASMDFITGGLKGSVIKERDRARKDGRSKYYRELPLDSRLKKIKEVIYSPDKFTGMDLRVADIIRDELLPAGLSVEEIDKVIYEAIKQKKMPEIEFFYGMGKNLSGWKALRNPLAVLAQGLAGVPGFDFESAGNAFWRGIVRDEETREHVFPSDISKELVGKTMEERYGIVKGTLANVGLSIIADPLLWADLSSTRVKQLTKAAAKMFSGEASLKNTAKTVDDLLKILKKDPKVYSREMKTVKDIEKITADPHFQSAIEKMDAISGLIQKNPPPYAVKAITEGTQGTRIPALMNERFGKLTDVISDVHKATMLDNAGQMRKIEDIVTPAPSMLEKGRAIPMPGEAPIPMTGTVPGEVVPDIHRAVRQELGDVGFDVAQQARLEGAPVRQAISEAPARGILQPPETLAQAAGELPTAAQQMDQKLIRQSHEMGLPKTKEGISQIDEVKPETLMPKVEGPESTGVVLRGTTVKDSHEEALRLFEEAGGEIKKIPEGVGKAAEEVKTGIEEGKMMRSGIPTTDNQILLQNGIELQDELMPIIKTGGSLRTGARYPGEVKDTVAGAFQQFKKIKSTGKIEGGIRNLTEKEMKELDATMKSLAKEWKVYEKSVTGKGRPELTELEKYLRKLDDNIERLQTYKRGTYSIRRTNKPGVTEVYKKYGETWKLKGEHTTNPDGEYLGSVFGYAQKFWDSRAARRAIGETAGNELSRHNERLKKSYISIEKQFQSFPIVGKAVKNMYSVKDAVQERGLQLMRDIAGQSLTQRWSKLKASDLTDIPLIFEDKKKWDALSTADQIRLQPIMRKVKAFFEEFKKGYADRGISVNFKDNIRNKWIKDNVSIKNMVDLINKKTIKKVGQRDLAEVGIHNVPDGFSPRNMGEVKKLLADNFFTNEQMIREVKNFEYIHIPYGQWFESGFDKASMLKALKIANAQGRKTFRIADLVDSGAIDISQVNLFDILGSYTQRAAQDFAMLDVKNAMKASNLMLDFRTTDKAKLGKAIKDAREAGWKTMDPRHFPMFDKAMLQPAMEEWLYHFKYERLNANMFDRGMSHVKVWQFANPFFLPYYDMMQGLVSRGPLGMLNPIGFGKDLMWAAKMMKNRPPLYYEIMHSGMQSKPMAMPYDQWMSQIEKLKNTNAGSYMWQMTKETVGSFGLRPIYEASWNTAWGLDKMVRLATTKYMMRKGMSTFDASQFAALIHSDYANVPMKIRRNLNRVMFTPSFKITMFRLYKEMIKSMVKVPLKKITGKGAELTLQEKQLAKAGTATVLGAMVGMDLFLQNKGYIRDQFARRYYKDIIDSEGKRKEDVIVFSSPLTMVPKYAYKLKDILTKAPYQDSKIQQIIDSVKWDIHPVWRIMGDLLQNRKDNGDQIWEPYGDSEPLKYAKMAEYSIESALAIIKQIGLKDEPDDQQEAWALYQKDMGEVFALISSPTTFAYIREPAVIRYKKKLERTKREWLRAIKDAKREGRFNRSMVLNGQRKLLRQTQDLRRAIEETERRHDHVIYSDWKKSNK